MFGAMNFPARSSPEILALVLIFFLMSFLTVKAPSSNNQNNFSTQDATTNFQPSLAVVVGILCIMFSLTLMLLIYAKCCHRLASPRFNGQGQDGLGQPPRFSGIDKTVIESLPFFRFSALKGTREGLECAVCLSKFEDIEILRLLPKCKHAFHIDCVDQWLEKHSSCPLCRHKVSEDDLVFNYSNSLRFLKDQSELKENSSLEIFVQREESSRFGSGRSSSMRFDQKGKKEEELPIQKSGEIDEILHKFNHKIIVSDGILKNRWSSVSSSDLMYLKSEMINSMSSNRFSPLDSNTGKLATSNLTEDQEVIRIKEEMGRKREFESKIRQAEILPFPSDSNSTSRVKPSYSSKELSYNEQRSMSEIVVHSRFTEISMANSSNRDVEDDRQRGYGYRLRDELFNGSQIEKEELNNYRTIAIKMNH